MTSRPCLLHTANSCPRTNGRSSSPSGRVQRSKQQPSAPGLPRPVPRPPNRAGCPPQAQKHRPQRLPPNQHPLPKPLRRPPGATKPAIPAWRLCSPVPSRHVLKPASPLRRVQRLQPRNRQPPSRLPHRSPRVHQSPPQLRLPSELAPQLRQAPNAPRFPNSCLAPRSMPTTRLPRTESASCWGKSAKTTERQTGPHTRGPERPKRHSEKLQSTPGSGNGSGSANRRTTLAVMRAMSLSYPSRASAPNHEIEPTENTAPPLGVS